jgi:hypothetical protein
MLVSETASVDTFGVAGPVGSVASLSEPGLNQNRLYALQSIERGECVMRLVRSLAGKDLWSAIVSRLCQTSSYQRRLL